MIDVVFFVWYKEKYIGKTKFSSALDTRTTILKNVNYTLNFGENKFLKFLKFPHSNQTKQTFIETII